MVLIKHTRDCERVGKLDQARQARKRLKELRILEENKRKADVFEKHVRILLTYTFLEKRDASFGECTSHGTIRAPK
jgi:hypothetical protein